MAFFDLYYNLNPQEKDRVQERLQQRFDGEQESRLEERYEPLTNRFDSLSREQQIYILDRMCFI